MTSGGQHELSTIKLTGSAEDGQREYDVISRHRPVNANLPFEDDGDIVVKKRSCFQRNSKALAILVFALVLAVIVIVAATTGKTSEPACAEVCSASEGREAYQPVEIEGLPDTKPNVLILLIDDLGYADVSATGAEYSTPAMDEIFTDGVWLSRLYGMPKCSPSRSALMTGRLTWKLGLQYNEVIHELVAAGLPTDTLTIGESLKSAGYKTGYYGRWALGHAAASMRPNGRGYDNFAGFMSLAHVAAWSSRSSVANATSPNGDSVIFNLFEFFRNEEGVHFTDGTKYNDDFIYDNLMKDLDSLEENHGGGTPWHMFWSPQTMHKVRELSDPPKVYNACKATLREWYCNKVKYLDEQFGNLTQKIKERGEWDNTLVFLLSDNGGAEDFDNNELPGQYFGSNMPWKGGKGTYYEGGIRLLAAMGGGWIPGELRGTTDGDRHHLVDISATIYDAANVTDPRRKSNDGVNLFAGNHNDQLVVNVAALLDVPWDEKFDDQSKSGTCVFFGEWKLITLGALDEAVLKNGVPEIVWGIVNVTDPSGKATHRDTDGMRCWETDESGAFKSGCLFNLTDDPQELNNVWNDNPDVVQEILAMITDARFSLEYNPGQYFGWDSRAITSNIASNQPFTKEASSQSGVRTYDIFLYPWLEKSVPANETWTLLDYTDD